MLDLEEVDADGLKTIEIKRHSLEKYRLIWHYARQFSTAMKNQCRAPDMA